MLIDKIIKRRHSSFCVIVFKDAESIDLHMDIILKYNISKGKNYTYDELKPAINENQILLAKQKAYSIASYSPKSKAQIIKRLKSENYDDNAITQAIESIERLDLIDDYAFAVKYINSVLKKKQIGIEKLKRDLASKGISKTNIEKAITEAYPQDSIIELAEKAAEKKLKLLIGKPKQKIISSVSNYLAYRGFDYDTIKRIIDKIK